jgi:2-methylisocitrate lyase-like PEP mutase family enzyme
MLTREVDLNRTEQAARAKQFLQLHHQPEVLVLPNVWDALGARLLVELGYPAIATASASIAFSLGYDDGEQISFEALLGAVQRISDVVDVPISVDLERGYADDTKALAENIHRLLQAGVVGINLEDSLREGKELRATEEQCERIGAVRQAAEHDDIPLVINARTDVFLGQMRDKDERLQQAVLRIRAYRQAGADCLYPIGLADLQSLRILQDEVSAPLNILATATTPDIATLQQHGVARLSLGPGLLRAAFTAMHSVAVSLQKEGNYEAFANSVTSDVIRRFVKHERMPD